MIRSSLSSVHYVVCPTWSWPWPYGHRVADHVHALLVATPPVCYIRINARARYRSCGHVAFTCVTASDAQCDDRATIQPNPSEMPVAAAQLGRRLAAGSFRTTTTHPWSPHARFACSPYGKFCQLPSISFTLWNEHRE